MKNTFGIIVAGRGIFPASLIAAAKEELFALLDKQGMDYVILPADATPTGAVQTMADAEKCAELFRKNSDKITGIIVCMPNFGEEAPIYHSIKMSGLDVPVLIQACDDDDDKLSLDDRRDSFCGKISVCNNLYYGGIKYSLTKLHTCPISSPEFAEDLDRFDRVCAVVYAMRHARVGLIGMRPDNFRTVRFSEKMLQKNGITTCCVDLSEIIAAANRVDDAEKIAAYEEKIRAYGSIPESIASEKVHMQAKLILAVKNWLEENRCDAFCMQCWNSLEENYGCAACLTMSMLGEEGIPGACESDVMGAVTMLALNKAAGSKSAYMDWNNNFTEDRNVCINQHCGNFPRSFFGTPIEISNLDILAKGLGSEKCFGACKAQVAAGPMTFAKVATDDNRGVIKAYFGDGEFLDKKIPSFGALSLWRVPGLQKLLGYICSNGFEHHVATVRGQCADILEEALGKYMGWEVYFHGQD